MKVVIAQWRIHGLGVGDVQKIHTLGLKFRERGEFQGDVLYYYNVTLTNVELIHHLRGEEKKEKEDEEGCGGGVWRRRGGGCFSDYLHKHQCSLESKLSVPKL